jgi:hypothetical protein
MGEVRGGEVKTWMTSTISSRAFRSRLRACRKDVRGSETGAFLKVRFFFLGMVAKIF